ncbi:hypothetical protein [Glaciibacter psychrotolerans]|uniref:Uncharacterized protein n=1 Tax=Glaciibacter psychrotolerans TaxID=670054 RepID=A0A7Z0EFD4_9MICO|nr:hypothetical protein [Leifsonia psychrotolerans]
MGVVSASALEGAPSAHAFGGALTVSFYDATGAALSGQSAYDLARNKADNLSNGYANKVVTALVNPTTLEDLNPGNAPLTPTINATNLTFALPSASAAAVAITWPTSSSRGYSQVTLDNGGAGFGASATVNFTYQAARDLKTRFDTALATRSSATPTFVASAAFTSAQAQLTTDYSTMMAAATESARGKYGWTVLGDIHSAYDILLKDYGQQLAKYKDENSLGSPWLGTTFDDATRSNTNTILGYAQTATTPTGVTANPQYGWVRIVFDIGTTPADYDAAVKNAHAKKLLVMGMPFDSTSARACLPVSSPTHCTPAEYQARFKLYVDHFSNNSNAALNIDAWEVGNEINGEWIDTNPSTGVYSYGSGHIATKVAAAADYVHAHTAASTVGTLYWQVATSNYPLNSTFTWATNNLIATGYASKLDVVLLSTYIEDAPLGTGFDQAMTALATMFGSTPIGLGEFDYFYTDTSRYFWSLTHLNASSTQAAAGAARPALATQYYSAALAYPTSVGGGFWWYFQEEASGTAGSNLRAAIKGVADAVYFG